MNTSDISKAEGQNVDLKNREDMPLEYNKDESNIEIQNPEKADSDFQTLLQDVLFESNDWSKEQLPQSNHSVMFEPATTLEFPPATSYTTPMAAVKPARANCGVPTSPAVKALKSDSMDSDAQMSYKELRKLRNRQAAARSRQRMQLKLKDLEKLVQDLQRKNRHLENLIYSYVAEKSRQDIPPNGYGTCTEDAYISEGSWQPFSEMDGQQALLSAQSGQGGPGDFTSMMTGMSDYGFGCYPQT